MGRIKQNFLKRIAEGLVDEYPDEFNIEFDNNKVKVQEYSDIQSKSMRNKIAGQISRSMRQKETKVL
ncbi:MAG: 30S ribosomal protein S17e [Candidatus Altiarchaeales archaeon ex4484_2]|nr:MAG: 30S ribosomal protein S17e [Candidatus Altiarchaeales archaeon ex4484_2]